ncbi:MAG: beta-propeller fold lactonase family protein [Bacteroidales bacterium]|nr:beta-propeller fold lactonase family protein [Bacteroidales bacterium]
MIFETDREFGTLELIGHRSTCGEWPRHFSFAPGENYLLVANQNSDNIVSFKRDTFTGLIEPVDTISAPSPVCILFR